MQLNNSVYFYFSLVVGPFHLTTRPLLCLTGEHGAVTAATLPTFEQGCFLLKPRLTLTYFFMTIIHVIILVHVSVC